MHAEVELYNALHGWCMQDMPAKSGTPVYNEIEAERAWSNLLSLYKTALA